MQNKNEVEKIVIAGAGQAAATAAFALRELGYQGRLTMIGEESHLPYERPQSSKEMLQSSAQEVTFMHSFLDYSAQSIDLILEKRIKGVDTENKFVVLSDGEEVSYDRLLIATGVRPRKVQCPQQSEIIYLRTLEDANQLGQILRDKSSLVIVGGGVIGLEVAASARALGCHVTVVEAGHRLMSRSLDEESSEYLCSWHRNRGVRFIFNSSVEKITPQGLVCLSNGENIQAGCVLAGIGVEPNSEPFISLGICDDQGVRVNEYGCTSFEDIYATGDVASQPVGGRYCRVETWANAQEHPVSVARNILEGDVESCNGSQWFWSNQKDLNLQIVGSVLAGEYIIRGSVEAGKFSKFCLDESGRIVGTVCFNSPKDMGMARRWFKEQAVLNKNYLSDESVKLRSCKL